MKIKTLTGHLTALEKRIISHLIQTGNEAGKSARVTVRISREGDVYKAITTRNESNDWGKMRPVNHTATFEVRNLAG